MIVKQILHEIDHILDTGEVKPHVDRIAILRSSIEHSMIDDERVELSNKIRGVVQSEAEDAWRQAGCFGCIFNATGTGKSKIAVNIIQKILAESTTDQILIVVPTQELRDKGWPDELRKWNIYDKHGQIDKCCYASLDKYCDKKYKLVILDEGHNITPANSYFFSCNIVESCLMLTATRPSDRIKIEIYKKLKMRPVYELLVNEAIKLGLVNPFEITIITTTLNNVDKYLEAGSKNKPFKVTEQQQYSYLSKLAYTKPSKLAYLKRMRFIYDLQTKTTLAKMILKNVIPENIRTLIFCGSIAQAIEVCDRRCFSKPTIKKNEKPDKREKLLQVHSQYEGQKGVEDFRNEIINRLSCVDSLNEGHNLGGIDCALIIQINSSEIDFLQRIGRIIRYRPGYVGKVIILCISDTIDVEWTKKAVLNIGMDITWVSLEELRTGKVKITF